MCVCYGVNRRETCKIPITIQIVDQAGEKHHEKVVTYNYTHLIAMLIE